MTFEDYVKQWCHELECREDNTVIFGYILPVLDEKVRATCFEQAVLDTLQTEYDRVQEEFAHDMVVDITV